MSFQSRIVELMNQGMSYDEAIAQILSEAQTNIDEAIANVPAVTPQQIYDAAENSRVTIGADLPSHNLQDLMGTSGPSLLPAGGNPIPNLPGQGGAAPGDTLIRTDSGPGAGVPVFGTNAPNLGTVTIEPNRPDVITAVPNTPPVPVPINSEPIRPDEGQVFTNPGSPGSEPWDNNASPDDPTIFDPAIANDSILDPTPNGTQSDTDSIDDVIAGTPSGGTTGSSGGSSGGGSGGDGGFDWTTILGPVLGTVIGGNSDSSGGTNVPILTNDPTGGSVASSNQEQRQEQTNNFDFSNFLSDIFSEGAISNVINLAGSEYQADKYEDIADKALDFQQGLIDRVHDYLKPYRDLGQDGINSGVLDKALSDLSLDDFNLNDIDTDITADTGIDPTVWEGFEDLPGLVGKTGDWDGAGLIERGSEEWDLITDDAIQNVMNRYTARGKSNTNLARDDATRAMIRAIGEIEGINNSRLGQEVTKRRSDLDTSGKLRSTEAYEQLVSGQSFFEQQSEKRAQIWREIFGEETTELDAEFRLNDQNMTRRDRVLSELLSTDAQSFNKLMSIVSLGQNAATGTAANTIPLSGSVNDIYGALASASGSRLGNRFGILDEILSNAFGGI